MRILTYFRARLLEGARHPELLHDLISAEDDGSGCSRTFKARTVLPELVDDEESERKWSGEFPAAFPDMRIA